MQHVFVLIRLAKAEKPTVAFAAVIGYTAMNVGIKRHAGGERADDGDYDDLGRIYPPDAGYIHLQHNRFYYTQLGVLLALIWPTLGLAR